MEIQEQFPLDDKVKTVTHYMVSLVRPHEFKQQGPNVSTVKRPDWTQLVGAEYVEKPTIIKLEFEVRGGHYWAANELTRVAMGGGQCYPMVVIDEAMKDGAHDGMGRDVTLYHTPEEATEALRNDLTLLMDKLREDWARATKNLIGNFNNVDRMTNCGKSPLEVIG